MSQFKIFREIAQIFAVRTPPPPAAVPLPFQGRQGLQSQIGWCIFITFCKSEFIKSWFKAIKPACLTWKGRWQKSTILIVDFWRRGRRSNAFEWIKSCFVTIYLCSFSNLLIYSCVRFEWRGGAFLSVFLFLSDFLPLLDGLENKTYNAKNATTPQSAINMIIIIAVWPPENIFCSVSSLGVRIPLSV